MVRLLHSLNESFLSFSLSHSSYLCWYLLFCFSRRCRWYYLRWLQKRLPCAYTSTVHHVTTRFIISLNPPHRTILHSFLVNIIIFCVAHLTVKFHGLFNFEPLVFVILLLHDIHIHICTHNALITAMYTYRMYTRRAHFIFSTFFLCLFAILFAIITWRWQQRNRAGSDSLVCDFGGRTVFFGVCVCARL